MQCIQVWVEILSNESKSCGLRPAVLGFPLLSLEFSQKEASDLERESFKAKARERIGTYKKGRYEPVEVG